MTFVSSELLFYWKSVGLVTDTSSDVKDLKCYYFLCSFNHKSIFLLLTPVIDGAVNLVTVVLPSCETTHNYVLVSLVLILFKRFKTTSA